MNYRAMFAVVRKDLKVAIQNKGMVLPMIIIMLICFGGLPWVISLLPKLFNTMGGVMGEIMGEVIAYLDIFIARMPESVQQEVSGLNFNQIVIVFILVYMLPPFFILIPLMVSTFIAADSFAGEKERKTLEALLYTPTTDRELFIAKILSGWLATIFVAMAGFVLYVIMANAAGWTEMRHLFFPNTVWLVIIFWIIPGLPGLALGLIVLISSRAQGFQDATQMGSLVMLPALGLIMGMLSGLIFLDVGSVLMMGAVIWLLDGLLIWLGSRSFHRNRLLST